MGCHTWFYQNKEYLDKQIDCEFHDLFRTYDDQDTILTSLEETLKYLNENNCQTNEFTLDKLKEFFIKYPQGVIDFG